MADKDGKSKVFCVDEIVTKEQLKEHGYAPAGNGSRQGTEVYYRENGKKKEIFILQPQAEDGKYKVCRKL